MPTNPPAAVMEFHVSRLARDRYDFHRSLFALSGNVIFANFHAARVFAQKMNDRRDLINYPERTVQAGQIYAMGLIDEVLHFLIQQYQQQNPGVMGRALAWLEAGVGDQAVSESLRQFAAEFPPSVVYLNETGLDDYLAGESQLPDGKTVSNRQIVLEEMLLLWLANANPAFGPYLELFDDAGLERSTAYPGIITGLREFFAAQPAFGPKGESLIEMLRAPALAAPHSLTGQLEYLRSRWSGLLGKYLYRLLGSLDLIREEQKAIFLGPGPSLVYDFTGMEAEPERFSPDREWMPNLVLIAKNSYVWLDQLSKKYKRPITRLDEIPDEELEALGRSGFSGLWLIGLWERSQASQRIKQLRGNPEAVASAYSLFSYEIAQDLGGEQAYQALRTRAWQYGIRLASDMVPNHMGIDSAWVVNHPDWFISLDYSPYPAYSFNGPNLSWDPRVGIYIEDHYFDNSDAAVVFKRVDFWTGSERYVYHGNDGTSMPWNDTAQLNYLLPEVREAVIQTILEVARRFPIIRFDAAMTLAKKHYQRLWFPEPGTGGAIPSRSEHGLTREQFDAAFPQEFWREVVDRVAQEVPDTLLLAEAFWLMEGYFVRTLGMHRVYNSAFMNMLRDEKNQEYRLTIKNTIEFDPEILKRYVNFMNNPDERTAVDQFGKGDKYFGVCTVMATMPGLPMFGHGQVEGYAEKYGMEFRRAYWDEQPDAYLVERHTREIFPLLRRRYLFAEVANFLLYDFFTTDGNVNEDVLAYSNRAGDERSLVLYHNKYSDTRGWVRTSAAYSVKRGEERILEQKTLGEGLALQNNPEAFTIFRDHTTGLEYIRSSKEICEQGLYAELAAYQYHVFLDIREVMDNEWHQYAQLAEFLAGRGVPSIDEALTEVFLQPVLAPFRELVNAGFLGWLVENRRDRFGTLLEEIPSGSTQALAEAGEKTRRLLEGVQALVGSGDPASLAMEIRTDLQALLSLPAIALNEEDLGGKAARPMFRFIAKNPRGGEEAASWLQSGEIEVWGALLTWVLLGKLGKMAGAEDPAGQSRAWIDEWLLGKIAARALQDLGLREGEAWRSVGIAKLLTSHAEWCDKTQDSHDQAYQSLSSLLQDQDVQRFIGVNRYKGELWFNKESFEELLQWLFLASTVEVVAEGAVPAAGGAPTGNEIELVAPAFEQHLERCYALVQRLLDAEEQSMYKLELLLAAAKA